MATTKPTIRTAYGPKKRVSLSFPPGSGRTKQSFKDECDINQILARFKRTRTFDFVNTMQPRYGDCTGLEFRQAMETVAGAKSMFHAMPAHLRARFNNDPAEFLDFVNDERNRDEARELGLLRPEEVSAPAQEPAASGAAGGAASPPGAGQAPSGGGEKPPAGPMGT